MALGTCPNCGSSNVGKTKGIIHPDPVDFQCDDCGYDNLQALFKDRTEEKQEVREEYQEASSEIYQ